VAGKNSPGLTQVKRKSPGICIDICALAGGTLNTDLLDEAMMLQFQARLLTAALLLGLMSAHANAQSAETGEKIFRSQCANCHVIERGKEKVGPSLFGVTGAGGPFTDLAELDRYLESPRAVLPETQMPYAGLKDPGQRKDLIAYLSRFN
jgi:cytochrome c